MSLEYISDGCINRFSDHEVDFVAQLSALAKSPLNWNTLIALLMQAKEKAEVRIGQPVRIVAIHEAGLDGFSLHRMLEKNGVESHVVDPASVAVPRRKRRAKSAIHCCEGDCKVRSLSDASGFEPPNHSFPPGGHALRQVRIPAS